MQKLEINNGGTSNTITTITKDNLLVEPIALERRFDVGFRTFQDNVMGCLRTIENGGVK